MLNITRIQKARKRYVCEKNESHVIEVGQPYKWASASQRATKRIRCTDCPDWRSWEVLHTAEARLEGLAYEFHKSRGEAESEDDVKEALDAVAEGAREIAEEKREAAQNREDAGFTGATVDDLNEYADELDSWADEVENATIPEFPQPEEEDCEDCLGTGSVVGQKKDEPDDCDTCEGSGQVTPDEPNEDQVEEWRQECETELSLVDEPPTS